MHREYLIVGIGLPGGSSSWFFIINERSPGTWDLRRILKHQMGIRSKDDCSLTGTKRPLCRDNEVHDIGPLDEFYKVSS